MDSVGGHVEFGQGAIQILEGVIQILEEVIQVLEGVIQILRRRRAKNPDLKFEEHFGGHEEFYRRRRPKIFTF